MSQSQSPPQTSIQCGTRLVVLEPTALFTGVVTEINYLTHRLTLVAISKSSQYDLSNAMSQKFEFKAVDFVLQSAPSSREFQLLEPESAMDQALDHFGICGECRQVFALSHAFAFGSSEDRDLTLKTSQNAIQQLRNDIQSLHKQKQAHQQAKEYDRVRDTTSQLKQKHNLLQQAQQTLQILPRVECPFCGWVRSL